MPAYKDNQGKWYVSVYYDNWQGERTRKMKRGIATKREAQDWEREFLQKGKGDLEMTLVGNMGKEKTREMLFWTKEEYLKFSEAIMDNIVSFYAFEMLYWCGLRIGELLDPTSEDFDFEKQTVKITKSYQRIGGKDVITEPKTPKSVRTIQMPDFLCIEMQDYIKGLYGFEKDDRKESHQNN